MNDSAAVLLFLQIISMQDIINVISRRDLKEVRNNRVTGGETKCRM